MTVHCLHLAHRQDRYDNMVEQAATQNFELQWWVNEPNKKNPKQSILDGHKMIIRDAKEKDEPYRLIAEDDCCFFDKGAYDYFLTQLPDDYDIFTGLIYVGEVDDDNRIVSSFSGGMTFYAIRKTAYDWMLNIPPNNHIDRYTGNNHSQLKLYVCNPYVVFQMGGYSDNLRRNLTYEVYLEGKATFKNN